MKKTRKKILDPKLKNVLSIELNQNVEKDNTEGTQIVKEENVLQEVPSKKSSFEFLLKWAKVLGVVIEIALLCITAVLLRSQNILLNRQNDKIHAEILIEEASRRSSFNFFLEDLIRSIDNELQNPKNNSRSLSSETIINIATACQSFMKYSVWDSKDETPEDNIPVKSQMVHDINQEKGVLIYKLIKSKLSLTTYDSIFAYANFKHTFLKDCSMENSYLRRVNLTKADLRGTSFNNSDLREADLTEANLKNTKFIGAKLEGVDFTRADLRCTNFTGASGLVFEQLNKAITLYEAKGIPDDIFNQLKDHDNTIFNLPSEEKDKSYQCK